MTEAAHHSFGPSSLHRRLLCPGSAAAEAPYEDTGSFYANEGTAAHHLLELCLQTDTACEEHRGRVFEDVPEHPVDDEMIEFVQQTLDRVYELAGGSDVVLYSESRLPLDPWIPGGFGTSDVVIVAPAARRLIVVDLKYGKGVRVFAATNPQTRAYALGALQKMGFLFDLAEVQMVIDQPRLDHVDTETLTVAELEAWADDELAPAVARAKMPDAPRVPGSEQCQFCAAKADCRELAEHVLSIASDGFDSVENFTTAKLRDTAQLTVEDLAGVLQRQDLLKSWLKAVNDRVFDLLKDGKSVPGWKLVAGKSNRKWADETAVERRLRRKLGADEACPRSLISVAQAEKKIGKKEFEKRWSDLVSKPPGSPSLAPDSDKRPALSLDPAAGFTPVDQAA